MVITHVVHVKTGRNVGMFLAPIVCIDGKSLDRVIDAAIWNFPELGIEWEPGIAARFRADFTLISTLYNPRKSERARKMNRLFQ